MKTILIADDKVENLYMLQALLQGSGFAVKTAMNGVEALETARRERPALIVADILMPEMDGFTLCREWKKDKGLRDIPFIFYTATYTDQKDETFALDLGADGFIVKPADPERILAEITKLIEGGPPRVAAAPEDAKLAEMKYLQQYNEVLINKLEDKLMDVQKANAELRALDMMKNNLLMNVSHELRTPLVVVRGYAELIGSGRSGPITEEMSRQCAAIKNNMDRLLHTINNLLFMADPEVTEKTRCVEEVELKDLVEIARECVRMKAEEKSIGVTVRDARAVVRGDRNELLTAVFNLLDNAVKFSSAGGAVEVAVDATSDAARISVSDTGIGIMSDEQQRIFEQFYQVDASTTRRTGGLGLGLSIVKRIAQRHGGRIELVSRPGKGSVFTLIIPL